MCWCYLAFSRPCLELTILLRSLVQRIFYDRQLRFVFRIFVGLQLQAHGMERVFRSQRSNFGGRSFAAFIVKSHADTETEASGPPDPRS